jgi:tetratricopeptide (TPR) repeat protein
MILFVACLSLAADPTLDAALDALKAVGKEAKGTREAAKAWKIVAAAPASELPTLLAAFDGANPLAVSYLQSAVDAVVEKRKAELSLDHVDAFLKDLKRSDAGRRLAFEILVKLDPKRKAPLLDSMLDDPAVELRRDAVQVVLDKAAAAQKAEKKDEARKLFQQALSHVRDRDQVESTVAALRKLGEPIDLARQFGFITNWKLIGPFENAGNVGWAREYPPEKAIDFAAEYDGKVGKVTWKDHESADDLGHVDLNAFYDVNYRGGVTYAVATFDSDKEQDVELRLASLVAWKVWVNGEKLFERFESHAGYDVDQYKIPARFKKGANVILLKVCQNEQEDVWAQDWKFALRVSDRIGTPILSTSRPPAKPSLGKPSPPQKTYKKIGGKKSEEKKK